MRGKYEETEGKGQWQVQGDSLGRYFTTQKGRQRFCSRS